MIRKTGSSLPPGLSVLPAERAYLSLQGPPFQVFPLLSGCDKSWPFCHTIYDGSNVTQLDWCHPSGGDRELLFPLAECSPPRTWLGSLLYTPNSAQTVLPWEDLLHSNSALPVTQCHALPVAPSDISQSFRKVELSIAGWSGNHLTVQSQRS